MNNECAKVRPVLSVYLDGEAEASLLEEIKAHIEICGACASRLRALEHSGRSFRMLRREVRQIDVSLADIGCGSSAAYGRNVARVLLRPALAGAVFVSLFWLAGRLPSPDPFYRAREYSFGRTGISGEIARSPELRRIYADIFRE